MPELWVIGTDGERSIPYTPGLSVSEILAATGVRVRAACGNTGACGLCRVRLRAGNVHNPTTSELNHLSADELRQGIRLACQVRPAEEMRITLENFTPLSGWRSLAEDKYNQPAFPRHTILGSTPSRYPYGIAVDLGTTQIRLSLWDMKNRQRLAGRSGLNPQAHFGADILARLKAAADSEKLARELSWLVKGAIGEALLDISAKTGADLRAIGQVNIVGNTAMLSLLAEKNYDLLLQPEYWTAEIDCRPADTTPWKVAWGLDPKAGVELIPPLAGFVGSDFLAAVLATRLTEGPAGSLLLDFGTNSEIGLWDGQTLWVTSAAGGPAFEGSGLSCGMPAEPGAIFKAEWTDSSPEFLFEVIGGVEAEGLCGSGMVDIIAGLIETGRLNRKGRFTSNVSHGGFLIQPEPKNITLKQSDIDVFQCAKSAIIAGTECLLEKAGLQSQQLQRLCVCGAFGRWLNVAHAQEIGLLPGISPQRVELHGNAALAGAELLLSSRDRSAMLESLKTKARVVNLAQTPEFEERFIEGLYFYSKRILKFPQDGIPIC